MFHLKVQVKRLRKDIDAHISDLVTQALIAGAKEFIKNAAHIPYVSGMARGSFQPFATAVGTRLPQRLPAAPNSEPNPNQSFSMGAAYQTYSIKPYHISFKTYIPYYNRWQDKWNHPYRHAVSAAQAALYNFLIDNDDLYDVFEGK